MDNPQMASNGGTVAPLKHGVELSAGGFMCLRELAERYVWWNTPDEALHYPKRVAAKVMSLGTWEDLTAMAETAGDEYLCSVLGNAEADEFDARSWHYRLGQAEYGVNPVPPMPVRKFE